MLTNLQRGNIQTQTASEVNQLNDIFQAAALGELFCCNLNHVTVNQVDKNGLTPILWAASYGQLDSVKLLQQKGGNIHYVNPQNQTNALILAAAKGHSSVVKHLLTLSETNINHADDDGNTALMYAVFGDFKNCVKDLLDYGADVTLVNSNLDTAYEIAIKRGFRDVQMVLEFHLQRLIQ